MMYALFIVLGFVVAISILVAIHEYGHYIVGRWCGMKVLRFSIGFGKPLYTWTGKGPDHTEYCIAAIPLGGYVKFLDDREGEVSDADQGRAFTHRPIPQRIAVLLAGPFFNFLFALFAYWALFVNGVVDYKPALGKIEPGSIAAEAGLQYGDQILSVGDNDAPAWEEALLSMIDEMVDDGLIPMTVQAPGEAPRDVVLEVGERSSELTVPGVLFDGLGISVWRETVLGSVTEGGPAYEGGLEPGDVLVSIAGIEITDPNDVRPIILERPGQVVSIVYVRDGLQDAANVLVDSVEADGKTEGFINVGIGQSMARLSYERTFGVVEAVGEAANKTWETTAFTLKMLGRMLTGDVSIKNISGPVSIAQYAGESAAAGLDRYVRFLALISISLGIINLFPVPILDGGQIVYQLIEAVKGSPLSERSQIIGQQFGIIALLILMSFAFYNDFARIFG